MSNISFRLLICALSMCARSYCVNPCNRTEYASVAFLSFLNEWTRCEGTLLNLRWVLTSSSCVRSRHPDEVTVELGVHHGDRNVTSIVPHPGFDPKTHRNDVALLAIEVIDHAPSLVYTKLPEPSIPNESENFGLMQWGRGEEIEPPASCAKLFDVEELRDPGGFLCAVPYTMESKGAKCASHRGGSLECDGVQVGVASWGRCDERPAYVYTEVTPSVVEFAYRTTRSSAGRGNRYLEVAVAVATGVAMVWALRRE